MVMVYVLFVFGIYFLIKGADWVVDGASRLANHFGVSNLVIGLTIVAFGTSLPELTIGIFSSLRGANEVVFGNIIGANIANVLLILGIAAIISEVNVKTETVWKQIPFAILAAFILFLFSTKTIFGLERAFLTRAEGAIFVSLLFFFLYSLRQISRREKKKRSDLNLDFDLITNIRSLARYGERKVDGAIREIRDFDWKSFGLLIVGAVMIFFAGGWVVDGAVQIALVFGLSEFLISATVISLGTTLPEFTVCIFASLRGKVDMAVGNAIGSTIFNIFGILGVSALIKSIEIPAKIYIDISIMFFAFLLLFIFMFTGKKHVLRKKDGFLFVLLYLMYVGYLIIRG